MATNVETKLRGLHQTGNEVNSPEGAFSQAYDVWHPEPDVIQPRPSVNSTMSSTSAEPDLIPVDLENTRALLNYGDRIVLHAGDTETLGYRDGGSGPLSLYSTPVAPADAKARTRGAEAGKNLYITSAEGIYRLSGTREPDLAGAPVATGFVSAAPTGTAGWLAKDMAVAYRSLFTTQDAFERLYVGSPSGRIIAVNSAAGTRNVLVKVLIPSGVTTDDYLRVYRTAEIESTIDPGDEMGLIHEIRVTPQMLSDGFYEFEDTTPSEIRGLNLYTNPNSGQGILQANDIPPAALDVTTWGNRLWAANTKRAHSLNLELLGVGAGAPGSAETGMRLGDQFIVEVFDAYGVSEEKVTFVASPPGSVLSWNTDEVPFWLVINPSSASAGVRETTKNLVDAINRSELLANHVRAVHTSGPEEPQGRILLERISPTQGRIEVSSDTQEIQNPEYLTVLSAVKTSNNLEVDFDSGGWGVENIFSEGETGHVSCYGMTLGSFLFDIVGSSEVVTVVGYTVTFNVPNPDVSIGNGISTDVSFTYRRLYPTAGTAWSPNLDTPVISKNDEFPHRLCYSKLDEFEAFPKLNYLDVGDETKAIRRIVPMRDRLYVFKEDGVFLVTGEFPFRVDVFDPTVRCFKPDSVAVANNVIFGVFDDAIYAITEGGAKRVDGNVKPSDEWNLASDILAVGDSMDGRYILWDTSNQFNRAWVYNIKTNDWVRWDVKTKAAATVYGDNAFSGSVYLVRYGQLCTISREFSGAGGGDYIGGYDLASPISGSTATIPTNWINPHRPIVLGDYLRINGHLAPVQTVTVVGGDTVVTFAGVDEADVVGASYVTHYAPFHSVLIWRVFHGGDIAGRKIFREGAYIFSRVPASGIIVEMDSDNTLWDQYGFVSESLETGIPATVSTPFFGGPTPQTVRFSIHQDHADCVFLTTGLRIKSKWPWELVGRSLTFEKSANYTGAI